MREKSTNGSATNFSMDFEFGIIVLFPNQFLFGVSYLPPEGDFKYEEINIYLGIIQIQYRWQ
jgi:hypothetical protein